ncbi:MAG: sulfate adenylyltransferase [Actinomycetota bacterium]|nr:sulfate adenylyltransferase [Actinomycetota bacterium]
MNDEHLPGPPPHGGSLTERLASDEERERWLSDAAGLVTIQVGERSLADLECLAVGAFSPLQGFMGRDDYQSVLKEMRLASGLVWSLPVTLAVDDEQVASLKGADQVALAAPGSREPLAIIELEEVFPYDRDEEARHVYRTEDPAHPGVAEVQSQGSNLVGGRVTVLSLPPGRMFEEHRLTPAEVRRECSRRGWRTMAGFQTRNPVHRAHEYLTKCALEIVDGLLLHPLVGKTKGDDIPASARMSAYAALLSDYYPPHRVLLSVFPAAMRYAGPREAIFHALCRKNYGCTHFIVGRDHAGVGNYYGSFEAHEIFDEFRPEEIGITPIFFDHAFWCRLCSQMATAKTCPHSPEERVALSGTEVRRRLSTGEDIPPEFSRPQVVEVLRRVLQEGTND